MKELGKGTLLYRIMAVLFSVMLITGMAVGAVSDEVLAAETYTASGKGWVLGDDGVLTIESDEGMTDWVACRNTYKSDVTEAVINTGVTKIEDSAFNRCGNLSKVSIPETVEVISDYVFGYCHKLTSVTLPKGITKIGDGVFEYCENLTSVTLPEGITEIGTSAFMCCSSLSEISIPSTVTSFGDYPFNASGLKSIVLPENITTITRSMFANCKNLTSVTLPKGITNINNYAFEECTALETVVMQSTVPPDIGKKVFENCKFITESESTNGIEVPVGYVEDYQKKWPDLQTNIKPDYHTHSGMIVDGQDATCTVDGLKDYYKCSCGKYFEEADCQTVISDLEAWKTGTGKLEKTGHAYAAPVFIWDGYKSAEAEFVCERDRTHKEVLNCTVNSEITKNPTSATGDEKTYTATVKFGGKTYSAQKTEVIPKIPETQKPSKEERTKNEFKLNAKLKVSQTGNAIKVSWGKVSGADGYDVYVQYCESKFTKKNITKIKSGRPTKATVKKINGKPINLKRNYKVYVVSYKLVKGKKITLGNTITAHLVGRKNTKYTNVKAVKVKKNSYSLKKGRTAQIKAKTVLVNPKKKPLSNAHAKEFRYRTTNKKVASVSVKGKIKAVGKGTCSIYVYARNGYAKKIKIKVK